MATNPTQKQMAELIRLQRQANRQRGCLLGILWTLLFGIFYWGWLAVKWTAILSWRAVMLGWHITLDLAVLSWRGGVWLYHASDRGVRALYARYGVRGVGVAVGALIVLVIVAALVSH